MDEDIKSLTIKVKHRNNKNSIAIECNRRTVCANLIIKPPNQAHACESSICQVLYHLTKRLLVLSMPSKTHTHTHNGVYMFIVRANWLTHITSNIHIESHCELCFEPIRSPVPVLSALFVRDRVRKYEPAC